MIATFLVLELIPGTRAWYDTGHMLIAELAKQRLEPQLVGDLDDLFGDWASDFPGMSEIVTAAVWPDHIKCNPHLKSESAPSVLCRSSVLPALDAFSAWHFSDLNYILDDLGDKAAGGNPLSNPSAVWALETSMSTFATSNSRWSFHLMLRFAVHILGDLHQPLHDATLVSNDTRFGTFLHGDRGGNSFAVQTQWGKTVPNLHSLWDAAGGLYLTEWPLSGAQRDLLSHNASLLYEAFPPEGFQQYRKSDMDCMLKLFCHTTFTRWAHEAHQLAVQDAYGYGISFGGTPSAEYIANAQLVSQKQIALAGYRLADLLELVLPRLPPRDSGIGREDRTFSGVDAGASNVAWSAVELLVVLQFVLLVFLAWKLLRGRQCAQGREPEHLAQGLLLA